MNPQNKTKRILNFLAKGIFGNFLISATVLALDVLLGGPKIYIERSSATVVFAVVLALFLTVVFWSIFTLIKKAHQSMLLKTLEKYMNKGAIQNFLPLQPGSVT